MAPATGVRSCESVIIASRIGCTGPPSRLRLLTPVVSRGVVLREPAEVWCRRRVVAGGGVSRNEVGPWYRTPRLRWTRPAREDVVHAPHPAGFRSRADRPGPGSCGRNRCGTVPARSWTRSGPPSARPSRPPPGSGLSGVRTTRSLRSTWLAPGYRWVPGIPPVADRVPDRSKVAAQLLGLPVVGQQIDSVPDPGRPAAQGR